MRTEVDGGGIRRTKVGTRRVKERKGSSKMEDKEPRSKRDSRGLKEWRQEGRKRPKRESEGGKK